MDAFCSNDLVIDSRHAASIGWLLATLQEYAKCRKQEISLEKFKNALFQCALIYEDHELVEETLELGLSIPQDKCFDYIFPLVQRAHGREDLRTLMRVLEVLLRKSENFVLRFFEDHEALIEEYGPLDPRLSPWKNHYLPRNRTLKELAAKQVWTSIDQSLLSQDVPAIQHLGWNRREREAAAIARLEIPETLKEYMLIVPCLNVPLPVKFEDNPVLCDSDRKDFGDYWSFKTPCELSFYSYQ